MPLVKALSDDEATSGRDESSKGWFLVDGFTASVKHFVVVWFVCWFGEGRDKAPFHGVEDCDWIVTGVGGNMNDGKIEGWACVVRRVVCILIDPSVASGSGSYSFS